MRPINSFVVKVQSRCDLSCDHCYIYEHQDQSWQRKPRSMAIDTAMQAAARIAEHARGHRLSSVEVILHGGEPLLVGRSTMVALLTTMRDVIAPAATVALSMQTNGVLLTRAMCESLAEHDVKVGVSLDGDRAANDRHRRFANGASSYDRVLDALALLREPAFRAIYGGILCTVDVRNDPITVYEAIKEQQPPRADFLLPHATWDHPPDRPAGTPSYGEWLASIHRRWRRDGRPFAIRLFDSILSTGRDGPSATENLGLEPVALAVIDTDGAWEQADSLKTAYDGAPETGMSVWEHSVDQVAGHPLVTRRQLGFDGLCATCRSCPVVKQCGGGLFAHRYRADNGFDNPSVYCADLMTLITAVNADARRADAGRPADAGTDLVEAVAADPSGRTVEVLARQQQAISLALVAHLARTRRGDPGTARAWALLNDIDTGAPEAVRTVLGHPFVRNWAVRPPAGDQAGWYLAALAAVAAVRAGADGRVVVAGGDDGRAYLPGLGTLRLGSSGPVPLSISGGVLRVEDAGIEVADPSRATAGWRPARQVTAGELRVVLEDGDPHRDCHNWPATGPLSADDGDRWETALRAAWESLSLDFPAYGEELARGLRTLTPLARDPRGGLRSATARDTFGDVGVALPDEPEALAVMLVHEFQHAKFGALLDLYDLVQPGDDTRVRVAWRADLRPVEGVLHGIHAHAAVADLWLARAARGADEATVLAGKYVADVRAAIGSVRSSGALTPTGEVFLEAVSRRADAWTR